MMEKKNTQSRILTMQFVSTVGCSLVLLTSLVISVSLIIMAGIGLVQWYVFGETSTSVDPFLTIAFAIVLGLVGFTLFMYLLIGWKSITVLHSTIVRYRIMKQEKARIDSLTNRVDVRRPKQSKTLLQIYSSIKTDEVSSNGKR